MSSIAIPKFAGQTNFTDEVKSVVHGYFKEHGISEKGDWRLFSKAVILLFLFGLLYYILVFSNSPPWWLWIPSLLFLGARVMPGIGFCIMHDAIHGGFSGSKELNYVAGLSLNFLGANNFMWKTKHNGIHHTHTNIDGFDEDIEAGPLLRLHPNQPWKPIHRHQHKWWYWNSVYSLLYLQWVWWNDYKKYFTKKILYKSIKIPRKEHIIFWVSKVFYVTVFVIIPIVHVGFWWWLLGYSVVSLICSRRIATVFQLAHVVEGVDQPIAEDVHKKKEFFIHQAETTADFAVDDTIVSWWVGGLNFQIEHHLFPEISHVHYPVIHRLIKPLLQKWDLDMVVYPTVRAAVASHVKTLFTLSQKPA